VLAARGEGHRPKRHCHEFQPLEQG
jgi:hypothetical protein